MNNQSIIWELGTQLAAIQNIMLIKKDNEFLSCQLTVRVRFRYAGGGVRGTFASESATTHPSVAFVNQVKLSPHRADRGLEVFHRKIST